MKGDRIFVNIDPPYDYVEDELSDIKLDETNRQTCTLDAVQSNAGKDDIFAFGGNLDEEKSPEQRASAFGKTASAVFRMVMLQAVQIPKEHWPEFGNPAMSRNKNAMAFKVTGHNSLPFQLLNSSNNNTKENARKYWSRYDQAFPHSLIENEVLKHTGEKVPFKNTMFILRRSAPQVIEINTKAYATMNPPDWEEGEFDCNVEVSCICKTFDQNNENAEILNDLREQVKAPKSSVHKRSRSSALESLKTSSKE